nr:hypothetical protein CFP56_12208 [Quercus suber]
MNRKCGPLCNANVGRNHESKSAKRDVGEDFDWLSIHKKKRVYLCPSIRRRSWTSPANSLLQAQYSLTAMDHSVSKGARDEMSPSTQTPKYHDIRCKTDFADGRCMFRHGRAMLAPVTETKSRPVRNESSGWKAYAADSHAKGF